MLSAVATCAAADRNTSGLFENVLGCYAILLLRLPLAGTRSSSPGCATNKHVNPSDTCAVFGLEALLTLMQQYASMQKDFTLPKVNVSHFMLLHKI